MRPVPRPVPRPIPRSGPSARSQPSASQPERIAVLELKNSAGMTVDETHYLSDLIRQAAGSLPSSSFSVITSDNVEELLPPDVDLVKCEDSCPIEIGRTVQASWILIGYVIKFGKTLRVNLKLYRVQSGILTASTTVKGRDVESLECPLTRASLKLFSALHGSLKSRSAELRCDTPAPPKPPISHPSSPKPPPAEPRSSPDAPTWIPIRGERTLTVGSALSRQESPPHQVYVGSFEMTRSEVTVGQFRACVSRGVCRLELHQFTRERGDQSRTMGAYCTYNQGGDHRAVNCVSWSQARAYCAWIGGRLPRESEWEYAARSEGETTQFPWGERPDWSCTKTNSARGRSARAGLSARNRGCGRDLVATVCEKPSGDTRQGLCDMSGNLWEWTADCDGQYHERCGGRRVSRGGGFWSNAEQIRVTRRSLSGGGPQMDVGFRCVRASRR